MVREKYQHPSPAEVERAFDNYDEKESALQDIKVTKMFSHIRKPKKGDWLYDHPERAQSYKAFQRHSFRATPHGPFRTLVVHPTGDFPKKTRKGKRKEHETSDNDSINIPSQEHRIDCPDQRDIVHFLQAFFPGLDVVTKTPIAIESCSFHKEKNEEGLVLTDSIFNWWTTYSKEKRDMTRTMLISLILTTVDMAPNARDFVEERGWLRGLAVPMNGHAVVSVARHSPFFFTTDNDDVTMSDDEIRQLVLTRTLITSAHEICHLLGLFHCVYYKCLMNGVSVDMEEYGHPLFLCPVCLAKLKTALGMARGLDSELERYQGIAGAIESLGLGESLRAWVGERMHELATRQTSTDM